MLDIALPKGRLSKHAYRLFTAAGYPCGAMDGASRKLIFTDKEAGVRYLLIKPADVAVYVERGAADIGVIGKDILLETEPDVYELMDLKLGRCALSVAAPAAYREDLSTVLRVGTTYPHVARGYYLRQNRDIEIVRLSGSVELAPVLGLSDVIVDIVETGATLRAHGLCVTAQIAPVSARLIANKKSLKFKRGDIYQLMDNLTEVLQRPHAYSVQ